MFRGLSEEFGLVKEAEQQLLLYNIFISHQLAAFQVGLHSSVYQELSKGTDSRVLGFFVQAAGGKLNVVAHFAMR